MIGLGDPQCAFNALSSVNPHYSCSFIEAAVVVLWWKSKRSDDDDYFDPSIHIFYIQDHVSAVPACSGWKAVNTPGQGHQSIMGLTLNIIPAVTPWPHLLQHHFHDLLVEHTILRALANIILGTPVASAYGGKRRLPSIFHTVPPTTECPPQLRVWLHVKWHSI